MQEAVLFLTGAFTGLVSALFGTGGGVVLSPVLILLYGMSAKAAAGTTLATLVPTALLGAYYHFRMGTVDLPRAALLALGGLWGLRLGAELVRELPEALLRRGFGAFLLVVALRLLLDSGK